VEEEKVKGKGGRRSKRWKKKMRNSRRRWRRRKIRENGGSRSKRWKKKMRKSKSRRRRSSCRNMRRRRWRRGRRRKRRKGKLDQDELLICRRSGFTPDTAISSRVG
jgi:hypothetical protein